MKPYIFNIILVVIVLVVIFFSMNGHFQGVNFDNKSLIIK